MLIQVVGTHTSYTSCCLFPGSDNQVIIPIIAVTTITIITITITAITITTITIITIITITIMIRCLLDLATQQQHCGMLSRAPCSKPSMGMCRVRYYDHIL